MSQRNYSEGWPDWVPPDEEYITEKTAKFREHRAFWRGVAIGGLIVGSTFIGSAAFGETITIGSIYVNGQDQFGTTVTISPSDEPGEWARVVMLNRYVNQGQDDGTYVLPFDGVTLGVEFLWDADPVLGSDRITILPPDGIICIPEDCSATVPEGLTGEIILIDWRGM